MSGSMEGKKCKKAFGFWYIIIYTHNFTYHIYLFYEITKHPGFVEVNWNLFFAR